MIVDEEEKNTEGPRLLPSNQLFFIGDHRAREGGGRLLAPVEQLEGRALVQLFNSTGDGIRPSRFGADFEAPHLPASMQSLEPALERCMAQRPPRELTRPPRSQSTLAEPQGSSEKG